MLVDLPHIEMAIHRLIAMLLEIAQYRIYNK